MKSILGIFLLIALSIQLDTKDFSIPFETQKEIQYPYYNIGLGKSEKNFILSLYYPCIIYDKSQAEYDGEETEKKASIAPIFSTEKIEGKIVTDSLKVLEEKSTKEMTGLDFLLVESGIGKEKIAGYFGLAPKADSDELQNLVTLDLLKVRGLVTNKIFSIGNIQRQTNGSYKGLLTLGKKHPDFQTTKGKSVTCTDKNDFHWGCDFSHLSSNGETLKIDSKSNVILVNEEIIAYMDYDKYLNDFKKLLPSDGECVVKDESSYSYYACSNWSANEMQVKLTYKLDNEYNLVLSVPEEHDLFNKEKKHYEFVPAIRFVKGLNDIFVPMIWFKNYHVLFSKEDKGKSSLVFHVSDESLIETVGEKKVDKSNYIQISKGAFIFLCISVGIVLIFLIMFVGYVRMTSPKNVRGIKSNKGKKGTGVGRIPTFDSSLLGTSSENMPRKLKTCDL